MRIHRRRLLNCVIAAAAVALMACDDEDIGEPCGTPPTDIFVAPIDGEEPVTEIVRLERDRACETFQCITHSGLNPYCTDTCELDSSVPGEACENDRDCDPVFGDPNENKYCVDGTCIDDDCPAGFVCRELQDVGTLAGETYCVRKSGCSDNIDCEDLGNVECRQLGCLDNCFLDTASLELDNQSNTANCPDAAANVLTCERSDSLPCSCVGGGTSCEDAALVCQPESLPLPWPVNTVAQRGVCFGVDQDVATQGASSD